MNISNRLRLVSLVLAAVSVYIGLEIDFRHWTWMIFLVLVPIVILGTLFVTRARKAGSTSEVSGTSSGKPKPKPDAAEE